jgi:hypothetical protein
MDIETELTLVTPVGGNVFVDLGFELEEAAAAASGVAKNYPRETGRQKLLNIRALD